LRRREAAPQAAASAEARQGEMWGASQTKAAEIQNLPASKRPVLGQWLGANIFLFEQKLQSPETEVAQLATAAECCQETGCISKKIRFAGFLIDLKNQ